MKKQPVYLIAAADEKLGIGKNGKMPWDLKKDLAFFQKVTTKTDSASRQNMVVMGRKTWESIPQAHRPLPGRRNVVLTRNRDFKVPPGVYVFSSLKDAFESADEDLIEKIFVIGGGKVFAEAVKARNLKGIYLTCIKAKFDCDTRFPKPPRSFKSTVLGRAKEGNLEFEFTLYKK
ncbi:MAG: dihydrofolate reductase [Candidatus Peregrinibacteria bacterium]